MESGADVNVVGNLSDYGKVTPLQCALKAGEQEVAQLLREYGGR